MQVVLWIIIQNHGQVCPCSLHCTVLEEAWLDIVRPSGKAVCSQVPCLKYLIESWEYWRMMFNLISILKLLHPLTWKKSLLSLLKKLRLRLSGIFFLQRTICFLV
uniref:Uncharacterized protein MANES_06G126700 n=1 Tax=Rhizophora mucronata TaxID=61149 RepID=A0A2P2M982_RHIMU